METELPKPVVVDTGFLYDLVLWRMTADGVASFGAAAPPQFFRGTNKAILSEPEFVAHVEALRKRRVVTWEGLLVELRYLGREPGEPTNRPPPRPFWTAWCALREELRIEAAHVDVSDFPAVELARLGPADLAVVALVRLHASAGAEILTIDNGVGELAREQGVLRMTVAEVLSP